MKETPDDAVRSAWREHREIALLDLREEDPYAQSHPLFAANLPASRIELDAWRRLPRRDVPVVVYGDDDGGEGLVDDATERLQALGYTQVSRLAGGLAGWRGELFRDVNVPSKAFGELVEARRHTPSLPAEDVRALLDSGADVVVLDARRDDEYRTMNIPGSRSVPGAELVLRARDLAPDPRTRIVVNCAGRTRSLIGAQSLINAGVPNPVVALRNGTIGWTLAGLQLERGQSRTHGAVSAASCEAARPAAQALARRAGVRFVPFHDLATLGDPDRTVHWLDVRTPAEHAAGHLSGFVSAPGGQLVQETDHIAAVRGARLVLADDDGVRAPMTGSWLAQMGWEVWVVDGITAADLHATGSELPAPPPAPDVPEIAPQALSELLAQGGATVIDLTTSANYVAGHVPGAWWALRSQWAEALGRIDLKPRIVLTCGSSALARFAVPEVQRLIGDRLEAPVAVLAGGTAAWKAAGLPIEAGEQRLASPRIDRYRRPYEGTDNPREAMQAYLDWEFGLVAQLERDGTHRFTVL